MSEVSTWQDEDLVAKYDPSLYAMYVEYPHKSQWAMQESDTVLRNALLKIASPRPALLYVHIPFCPRQCYYCTCHTVITRNYPDIQRYLGLLHREIEILSDFVSENRIPLVFNEIHVGGGSPTMLRPDDFSALVSRIGTLVSFKDVIDFSIEIDPRGFDPAMLSVYHKHGINRLSFGVQDFDPEVQKAVNRIQPAELFDAILTPDVRKRFHGINFDVMWGLPRQTIASYRKTIETVIRLSPDRVSLLYLHMAPELKKHQQLMKKEDLPSPLDRARMFQMAAEMLVKEGGYVRIGFEHFAKPDDNLAIALRNKTLFWNPLGYTSGRYSDILGVGTGSSSCIQPDCYSQNTYSLEEYARRINANTLPSFRACQASTDNIVHRDVIQRLRSYCRVDFKEIGAQHKIDFKTYFAKELRAMDRFVADRMVEIGDNSLRVTERGRFFMFHICRAFDQFA